jgi:hypothetical protein
MFTPCERTFLHEPHLQKFQLCDLRKKRGVTKGRRQGRKVNQPNDHVLLFMPSLLHSLIQVILAILHLAYNHQNGRKNWLFRSLLPGPCWQHW